MSRFLMTITADFSTSTVYERVINALQVRQTSLVVDKVAHIKDIENSDRPIKTKVIMSLPENITRQEFAEWVLESMRGEYSGPPFVIVVDRLLDVETTTTTTTTTLKP